MLAYGLALFDVNGNPTLTPIGPFGAMATMPTVATEVTAYELMTPTGSVPGRTAGTDLTGLISQVGTSFEASAAVSRAGMLVKARMAEVPNAELVDGLKPDKIRMTKFSIDGNGSPIVEIIVFTRNGGNNVFIRRMLGGGES